MGLLLARSLVFSCFDIYRCITAMVFSESLLTGDLIISTLTKLAGSVSKPPRMTLLQQVESFRSQAAHKISVGKT
jgi:uncharacterized membrane protein